MTPGTLGIVGTGLIGGSLGAAARARGWKVLGFDANEAAAREALEVGAIDRVCAREELYARSDVVAIAAYVDGTIAELVRLRDERPAHPRLIIDVASVKEPIAAAGANVARFVATHPMAGTEHRGARHARADLFAQRTWAYVRSGEAERDELARTFIVSFDAVPLAVDAAEHDAVVALTSHCTQVLAHAYAQQLGNLAKEGAPVEALCGATARELARLGRAPLDMWRSVFATNGANIARELRALIAALQTAADSLERTTA